MDGVPIQVLDCLPSYANVITDGTDGHTDNHEDTEEAIEQQLADHSVPPAVPVPSRTESGTRELWTKTPRARGRQARDPHAEFVRFDCKGIDDLETTLRGYLEAPTAAAEHATVEFHFPTTAAFMVYTRDFRRDSSMSWTSADVTDLMRKTAVSVAEVLTPTEIPKDQVVRQKAVARTVVEAVQRADKFRYTFHNNWLSREDRAHRFSFFCNDSTLNKGRAANGGAGTEGRKRRKPVYDCKGLIAVKFSVTKNNLEVHYRHVPIHKTFDERAPVPRRESKRRRMMEVLDPDGLETLRSARKQRLEGEDTASAKKGDKGVQSRKSVTRLSDRAKKRRGKSEGPQRRNADEQAIMDEGLQPLVDFLGSAQIDTPGESQASGGEDGEDNDGVIVLVDDDVPTDVTRSTAAVLTREHSNEQHGKSPRRRAKLHGPLLPGMMEGSMVSGSMDWNANASIDQRGTHDVPKSNARDTNGQLNGMRKEKTKEVDNTSLDEQKKSDETELEMLKRRLHDTEQRLMRIESEERVSKSLRPPLPPPHPLTTYPLQHQYPYPPSRYPYHPYPQQYYTPHPHRQPYPYLPQSDQSHQYQLPPVVIAPLAPITPSQQQQPSVPTILHNLPNAISVNIPPPQRAPAIESSVSSSQAQALTSTIPQRDSIGVSSETSHERDSVHKSRNGGSLHGCVNIISLTQNQPPDLLEAQEPSENIDAAKTTESAIEKLGPQSAFEPGLTNDRPSTQIRLQVADSLQSSVQPTSLSDFALPPIPNLPLAKDVQDQRPRQHHPQNSTDAVADATELVEQTSGRSPTLSHALRNIDRPVSIITQDSNLKGLFDSALAAITQPHGPISQNSTPRHPGHAAVNAAKPLLPVIIIGQTDSDSFSVPVKGVYGVAQPPTGASVFQLPTPQSVSLPVPAGAVGASIAFRDHDGRRSEGRAALGHISSEPSATGALEPRTASQNTSTAQASSHPRPYPVPQYSSSPPEISASTSYHLSYPSQAYLQYPAIAGYLPPSPGHSPCLTRSTHQHVPTFSQSPRNEDQRILVQREDTDNPGNTPAWATQL